MPIAFSLADVRAIRVKRALFVAAFAATTVVGLVAASAQDRNRVVRMGRSVTVENLTGEIILNVYATNKYDKVWDIDLLGKEVIMPGHRRRLIVDDYSAECMFDVRVRTKSNRTITASGNVCGSGAHWSVR